MLHGKRSFRLFGKGTVREQLLGGCWRAGVPLIPVHAEAAGKAPSPRRSGAPLTGADVMEAALAEQQVAKKAASFFKPGGEGVESGT